MTTLMTAEDRFCDLSGDVRLCYRTAGDPENPAMLLIAGLGSDLTIWPEPMVDALVAHGFFVVRFDNRDVGRSSRMRTPTPSIARLALGGVQPDGYDLAAMATDTVGLLDHLGLERVHIVGMSMGGMIGQTIAARFGDRVTSLCSIFSTTGSRRVGQPAWSTRLRIALPAASTREQAVQRHVGMMRHIAGTTMPIAETGTADYAANAWDRAGAQNNAAGVIRQINAIYLSGDRTSELRAISAPTLVIHGDTDKMVNPSGGAATAAAIPGAWMLTIAGMGHDLAPQAIEPVVSAVVEHTLHPDRPPAPVAARSALLPPGPRWPAPVAAIALSAFRPRTMAAMVQRYGPEFSMRIPLVGPCVVVTDPAMIKNVFQKPTGELAPVDPDLSVMLGSGSTFGLRGEAHRQRRKLLAPPFHGKRMRAYEQLIQDETMREISAWPSNMEFEVMPSTMRITLNIILRAVFGADGTELDELRELLPRWVEFGSKVFVVPFLHRDLGRFSPWGRHLAMRRQFDVIMESLIAKALADPGFEDRDDVLSLLLRARYDDGTAMTHSEIGDELVTLLAAGHETTATTLAWTLERLRRYPDVLRQLVEDIDAGESKMLQTTIFETQRVRPVIDGVARSVAADNVTLGRWILPRGHRVWISATAVHNDPSRYPDPNRFNPDRFLDTNPDNFAWVPFGGGTRRCIGAAFANMEMTVVLRTVLRHYTLAPTTAPDEKQRFRGVAFAPARGGRIRVQPRPQQSTTAAI